MEFDKSNEAFTSELLRSLYRVVYEREVSNDQINMNVAQIKEGDISMDAIVATFVNSAERFQLEADRHRRTGGDASYGAPRVLERHETIPRRIALVGSCLMYEWVRRFSEKCPVDFVNVNFVAALPDAPPHPAADYDFQIIQLPLRSILPEDHYLALRYDDHAAFEALFEAACRRLEVMLEANLKWNSDPCMLTFVCNFLTPQQHPLGRFSKHRDLRNPIYLIECLSEHLSELVNAKSNSYLIDINNISRLYGARYHQDDALLWISHHGLIADYEVPYDGDRLDPLRPYCQIHPTRVIDFVDAVWAEVMAMYRTLRGDDAVKLVIFDLDDTLWRGVAAEGAFETLGEGVRPGWSMGLMEAVWWLRSRGILLAIASKNDEGRIRELWSQMTNDLMRMDDFVVTRINWRPKTENIAEILELTRILPKHVLFVDDNPLERAAVRAAYPEIRTLGEDIYDIRRVLLWAPELQTPVLTEESTRRTEMVQAQVSREALRGAVSRDEFLASLNLSVTLNQIEAVEDPRFARAFELLNETNQFNTTGERWRRDQAERHFEQGGVWFTFDVEDSFTRYGLVGVVIVNGFEISQWAMSCRVLGLDVEYAVLQAITARFAGRGGARATALVMGTDHNFICRGFYETAGFKRTGEHWELDLTSRPDGVAAAHIRVASMA